MPTIFQLYSKRYIKFLIDKINITVEWAESVNALHNESFELYWNDLRLVFVGDWNIHTYIYVYISNIGFISRFFNYARFLCLLKLERRQWVLACLFYFTIYQQCISPLTFSYRSCTIIKNYILCENIIVCLLYLSTTHVIAKRIFKHAFKSTQTFCLKEFFQSLNIKKSYFLLILKVDFINFKECYNIYIIDALIFFMQNVEMIARNF